MLYLQKKDMLPAASDFLRVIFGLMNYIASY